MTDTRTMTRKQALDYLRQAVRKHLPNADEELCDRVVRAAVAMPGDDPADVKILKAAQATGEMEAEKVGWFGVWPHEHNDATDRPRIVNIEKGDRFGDIMLAMFSVGFTYDTLKAVFGANDGMLMDAKDRAVKEHAA
jgi:hypothetical protein